MEFDARSVLDGLTKAEERRRRGERAPGVDGWQLARDVLLSEQEFRRAGEYLSGRSAAREGRDVGLSDWAKGLGWGTLAVASVTPFGSLGKVARAVRAGEDLWDVGRAVGAAGDVAEAGRAVESVRDVERAEEVVSEAGRLQPSLLRPEGGLFEANLPGSRVQELAETMIARQVDSPLGLAAVPAREIGAALRSVPEVRDFLKIYRETVARSRMASSYEGTGGLPSLVEFARRAGVAPPSRVGRGPEMSLDAALIRIAEGEKVNLPDLRAATVNLGTRLRNSSIFLTDDIYTPSFYVEFNRILGAVEKRTGMPVLPFSIGLAAASAKAAPYDEIRRIRRVAPMLEYRNGRAYFPSAKEIESLGRGNHPLYPALAADGTPGNVDSIAVVAGRGLADAINNPNMFSEGVFGLAAKTTPYAYLRYDPAYGMAYVSDTVDGLGQFLIKGNLGKIDTTGAVAAVQNQFAGRMLAEIYGVPASNVQEAIWAYIRIARDGFLSPKKGGWSSDAIAPSFRGAQGSAEDILVEAVEAMDPRIVRLAKQNHDRFVSGVRSGDEIGWDWDAGRNMPAIQSEEFLITPAERVKAKGRAVRLQEAMLNAVGAAAPVLRSKLMALSLVSGVSLPLLIEALGESGDDIPVEVLNA